MWYDFFSLLYDGSLERLYEPVRQAAFSSLSPVQDGLVLDLACGTGQNFPFIQEVLSPEGIVGVDRSKGMLRMARKRCEKEGWDDVTLVRSDIHEFDKAALEKASGVREVEMVLCTLGLSVFKNWEEAFYKSIELLKPGGQFVMLDCYAEKRTFQTLATEWLSGADLSRKAWLPLERTVQHFEKKALPGSPSVFGGDLYMAFGEKR